MPVVGEDGLDELIYLIKHDDYELQTQIDAKQATLTGAATTIASSNLTASRALISNASGKVAVSAVTSTELGYLDGVTSAIQTQLDAKQATLTGAATTIASSNLTASRVLISDASGKVAVSAVTSTELRYLDGVTSNIQTQLDNRLLLSGGTLTGVLTQSGASIHYKSTNIDETAPPTSSNTWGNSRVIFKDTNGDTYGQLSLFHGTNDRLGIVFGTARDGVSNYLYITNEADGTAYVSVSSPKVWRSALGLGTSGAFPITIAQGGTGLTSSPSMLTNLASTTAANVLAASPRPGVTGTLPLGNGGTGATTAAGAKTNIGLDWLSLYSSTNGTNGTVTLTSTCISSTRTMKVFFKDNNNKYAGCLDVPYPTGSMTFPIYAIEPAANGSTLIRRTLYTINAAGNTLTPSYGGYIQIATSATSGTANTMTVTGTANGTNYLKIFRVYLVPM